MNCAKLLDIYTDYLIVQNAQATATGCSELLDNKIKHDSFTRLLSSKQYDSKYLWEENKKTVRTVENNHGILILDNSIIHKTYSSLNEVINYHYDHAKGSVVKGMNLLTALVRYNDITIPVGFEMIIKDQICIKNNKNGQEIMVRKSRDSINDLARNLVKQTIINEVKFSYILGDSWFSSKQNILFFSKHKRKFILGIPPNRLVALSLKDAKAGNYDNLNNLGLKDGEARKVYLNDIPFPVVVTHKVFKNDDGVQGELHLVTNELTLSGDHIYDLYQRRWSIETYHRSLKQNASVGKSPTKVKRTQTNHVCLSLLAYSKIEQLKVATSNNHYAIKRQLLIAANQASYLELQKLRSEIKMTA